MKRFLALILTLILILCLAGCTSDTPASPAPDTADSSQTPAPETPDFGSNVLPSEEANNWGITLNLKDLTRIGATIVCTQSGGKGISELNTGSYFILEQLTENGWQEVEQLKLDGYLAWTAEAYIVNLNGTTEWALSWEWLYGELPDGHYRLGKEFMNFRGPGDYDKMMIYTEFSFGQMPIAE